jgi:hypothetical protein
MHPLGAIAIAQSHRIRLDGGLAAQMISHSDRIRLEAGDQATFGPKRWLAAIESVRTGREAVRRALDRLSAPKRWL